jgi:hypothetical protein
MFFTLIAEGAVTRKMKREGVLEYFPTMTDANIEFMAKYILGESATLQDGKNLMECFIIGKQSPAMEKALFDYVGCED